MPTTRTTHHARWDCHACGDCCRLYNLGPVEPRILQGLIARDVGSDWEPAGSAPWFEAREAGAFLTHRDGHCVFLRDDNLCAVHALYGAEAKPSFCREYPFQVLDDPDGTVVVVRASCTSAHKGDTPVLEQAKAMVDAPSVFGRRRFAPEQVELVRGVAVPLSAWMQHEARLLALIDDDGLEVSVALARLRSALLVRAGAPSAVPDAQAARMATGAVLEGLRRLMERAACDPDPSADRHRLAFAQRALGLLTRALAGSRSPRPLSAAANDYLLGLLRSFLLTKSWGAVGSVLEGLGVFVVQVAVVQGGSEGDGEVAVDDAAAAVVTWTKMIENPAVAGLFRLARPALWDAVRFAPGAEHV